MIETRFKVGDIVRIKKNSQFWVEMPENTDGEIFEIDNICKVRWDNGYIGFFYTPDRILKLRRRN